MIITTFNIRGLGGLSKRKKVRDLVSHNNVDFLALQETKMETVTNAFCYSLWGNDDCEWAFLPSIGNSGGILSIWRKSQSNLISTFLGKVLSGCVWSGGLIIKNA
jgi:hypothetical protein